MRLPVHNAQGKRLRQITVDDSVFGITPNMAVLHQAFVAQRANQRRGTASTKTRAEVQGSTRKIRTQKYTGRARRGSNRSPVRVGGGVAFGPRPRSYRQKLLKKMKRLAIRSALSGKLADGQLRVVDELSFAQPRTKEMVRVLHNAGIQRSALVVTGEPDRSVLVSARNLQKTKVLPAAYLNVVDLLTHRDLLLTEEAVRRVEGLWGDVAPEPAVVEKPKPRRRRARAAQEPPAETEAALEEPKPRRRRAAPAASVEAEEAPEKSARRTRRPKAEADEKTAKAAEERPRRRRAAPAASAGAEEAAEKPARRTRRPKAEAGEKTAKAAGEPRPARRRARAKKDEEP
jgi:large subunit ribosomal protein L4